MSSNIPVDACFAENCDETIKLFPENAAMYGAWTDQLKEASDSFKQFSLFDAENPKH